MNLIVFSIDKDQLEPELVHGVKEAFPDAGIFVRAFDRRTLIKLGAAPIDHTVREVRNRRWQWAGRLWAASASA